MTTRLDHLRRMPAIYRFNDMTSPEHSWAVWVWLTVIILAFFGGLSRLLLEWQNGRPWQQLVGALLASVFVGVLLGLAIWEPLYQHPTALLACTSAAGWLGADIGTRLSQWVLSRRFGISKGANP